MKHVGCRWGWNEPGRNIAGKKKPPRLSRQNLLLCHPIWLNIPLLTPGCLNWWTPPAAQWPSTHTRWCPARCSGPSSANIMYEQYIIMTKRVCLSLSFKICIPRPFLIKLIVILRWKVHRAKLGMICGTRNHKGVVWLVFYLPSWCLLF